MWIISRDSNEAFLVIFNLRIMKCAISNVRIAKRKILEKEPTVWAHEQKLNLIPQKKKKSEPIVPNSHAT
jgi:hypothetical protein